MKLNQDKVSLHDVSLAQLKALAKLLGGMTTHDKREKGLDDDECERVYRFYDELSTELER